MSLRDQILAADDLPREAVEVPEWGCTVFVRTMTGAERDSFELSMHRDRGDDEKANVRNIRARLAVLTVIDSDGLRVFKDEDADALGQKSAAALDRVFAVSQRLNGLSPRDVEDMAKNSDGAPSDGSGSCSL